MRNLFVVALCMAVSCAFAGNKKSIAKVASNNKSQVVYVYKNDKGHGMFYHTSGDCCLKVREYIHGEKAGISTTKESTAKDWGALPCPTCGHKHEGTKSVAAK